MPSLRKAINDHCKSCGYDSLDKGTWRYQIEICPVTSCKLYDVRPITYPKQVNSQEETEKAAKGTGGGS
jgi:hypothetical protein